MSNLVKAAFRHRALQTAKINVRHHLVLDGLERALATWLVAPIDRDAIYSEIDEMNGAVELTPAFQPGIRGAISYCPRRVIDRDHAMYDDVLTLEFRSADADYEFFVTSVFAELVTCFSAYRANVVLDEDLDLEDYERILDLAESSGRDIDGRDGVFRIGPVNFFDKELCYRGFGLSPQEITRRLMGNVELAQLLDDGVLIVATSKLIDRDTVIAIDQSVRKALGVEVLA